jgi:hypothetical protein
MYIGDLFALQVGVAEAKAETYTRIPDMYPVRQIVLIL